MDAVAFTEGDMTDPIAWRPKEAWAHVLRDIEEWLENGADHSSLTLSKRGTSVKYTFQVNGSAQDGLNLTG